MTLTSESKFFLGIILSTLLIIGVAIVAFTRQSTQMVPLDVLIPAGTHTVGSPEAKVQLVEFSDFQCPACHLFQNEVERIITMYPDQLLFAYRHFPIPSHAFALNAAKAAEAAGNQEKFFEMARILFDHQNEFSDNLWEKLAQELNLDMEQFRADMTSSDVTAQIEVDIQAGNQIGINATPTFFLNGTKLTLTQVSDLESAVKTAITDSR